MILHFTRRGLVRTVSYISAVIIVLAIYAVTGSYGYSATRTALENGYSRSLEELSGYIAGMSVTLEKSMYSGTEKQLDSACAKLWREATGAKAALSTLPVYALSLDSTNKYISQAGEYAMSLTRDESEGVLSDTERENLLKLAAYGEKLSSKIYELKGKIEENKIRLSDIASADSKSDETSAALSEIADGFAEMESGFDDFPSLIYDGPFSDGLLDKKSVFLSDKSDVSRETARKKAAAATGISLEKLYDSGDEDGNMPLYCFSANDLATTVGVTKKGGYLAYIINYRTVGEETLTPDKARERAASYFQALGIRSLTPTYYFTRNGVCTFNYAYVDNSVTCYTDLIKVEVALDNGEILGFDARGYLNNHMVRNPDPPKISEEKAAQSLSNILSIVSKKMCIIPSSGKKEVYCYEFKCRGYNNETVLVYINADTGSEEQILILSETEDGTLTE